MERNLMMNLAAGFAFLVPGVIWDIRTRLIPGWYLLCALAIAAAGRIVFCLLGTVSAAETLACLLPGCFLLLLSYVTREKIGLGDGICFLILGLIEGGKICTIVLLFSFLLSSVYGGILLVMRKTTMHYRIPFLPFVMGGMAAGVLCLLI